MPRTVQLIDPIDSVTTEQLKDFNGTPEYEKMFIFAELIGRRRSRSVITIGTEGGTQLETVFNNQDTNMLGADFDGNTGERTFTTKWTDNATSSETLLEGFGIENISIRVNSSFIPEIIIDFVDIRGLSFFNQTSRSPYALLFDFPPPVFKLSFKGYYGRTLDFDIHLKSHSTKFDSSTGNYNITAEFIGRTFAPLTDIPFNFVQVFPLLENITEEVKDVKSQEQTRNGNTTEGAVDSTYLNYSQQVSPRNTFEMIEKLKTLNDSLNNLIDASEESNDFEESKQKLTELKTLIDELDGFSNTLPSEFISGTRILIKENANQDNSGSGQASDDDVRVVNSVTEYNSIIRGEGNSGDNSVNTETRLYLGIKSSEIRDGNISEVEGDTLPRINAMNALREELLESARRFPTTNFVSTDIKNADTLTDGLNGSATDFDFYIAIDITQFYTKLRKAISKKTNDVQEAQESLTNKINDLVRRTLGFEPTIYNVFKIICDDIDKMFRILGGVSEEAESHHTEFFNRLIDSVKETKSRDVTKEINAFPLVTETRTINNVDREVRAYPAELSSRIPGRPFPETILIDDIINTFIRVRKFRRVNELKSREDAEGNNEWIPVSPADSELIFPSDSLISYASPYANIELRTLEGDAINNIYNVILNRFYVASQFTYANGFYSQQRTGQLFYEFFGGGRNAYERLVRFVAEAEAVNLANSVINQSTRRSLADKVKTFKRNPDAFYSAIEGNISNFNIVTPNLNGGTNEFTTLNNDNFFYRNRTNENYKGFEIIPNVPAERVLGDENSENATNPVLKFLNEETDSFSNAIREAFEIDGGELKIKSFSQQNIPIFTDQFDGNINQTKYLNPITRSNFITRLINGEFNNTRDGRFDESGDFQDLFASILSVNDDEVVNFLNNDSYSNELKAFILVSQFLRARSYFSEYGTSIDNGVNKITTFFSYPAIVEVPYFSVLYMGGLCSIIDNDNNLSNDLDTFYNSEEWIQTISAQRELLDDDLSRIVRLSEIDKNEFKSEFNRFIENSYADLSNAIIRTYDNVSEAAIQADENEDFLDEFIFVNTIEDYKYGLYEEEISAGSLTDYRNELMTRYSIVNFSDITFSNDDDNFDAYEPLSVTNQDAFRKQRNDLFFNAFWEKLEDELPNVDDRIRNIENEINNSIDDKDIKNQLYYSLKTINDKWIAGINTTRRGYPLNNNEDDSLISKFAFVDRAMNPIGNKAIIDPRPLIEMSKDFDLNIFNVFARLLSLNNFEFFPLQNFMTFDNDNNNWKDSFKIFESADQKATPAFICMYLGGTSSTLNSEFSQFDDDGILDLEEEGTDFNVQSGFTTSIDEVSDSQNRSLSLGEGRFNYSEPKAFRVRFAEQNQSFFIDIEIDGKEFTQTADSLAILSEIAGDNSQASPVPKGQNLFSIYENRAYSVRVTMLGNAMIQPTQYFQLENIPMYSGAYLITNVEHRISDNHMLTIFEGTRILKYPNPYVVDYATSFGIETFTPEEEITGSDPNEAGTLVSANNLGGSDENYFNSMFSLKLSP